MHISSYTQKGIERLRSPIDWRALDTESHVITNLKVRKANELKDKGVAAVLFSAEAVADRIESLAALEHYFRNGDVDHTVYASILKGGVQFTVPFMGHMARFEPGMDPKVDYLQATRYGLSQEGGALEIVRKLDPKTDIQGKTLIFTDDVTDEGITLEELARISTDPNECTSLGDGVTGPASRTGAIVLGDKQLADYSGFDSDLLMQGFWLPNAWAGGMGLDGPNEAMRWLPEIVLTSTQHEKYREELPEILDILGERAVIGFNEFNWISD